MDNCALINAQLNRYLINLMLIRTLEIKIEKSPCQASRSLYNAPH